MTDEAKRCVEALRDNINNGFLLVGGFNGSVHASEIIDLIESLSAQLDAAVRDMGMTAHCDICGHHRNNGGNCIGVSMCGEHRPRWQWRGAEVECWKPGQRNGMRRLQI